jgi:hypothetical protein
VNGNFNRVNRQGDDKITVEGWLSWDPPDRDAQLSIAVTQDDVTVSGSGHVQKGDKTWKIEIQLNGDTFTEGFASGLAAAVVRTTIGSTSQNWQSGPIEVN